MTRAFLIETSFDALADETHFTDPTGDGWTPQDIKVMRAQNQPIWCHPFEAACADLDIEHRLTKSRHSWTAG